MLQHAPYTVAERESPPNLKESNALGKTEAVDLAASLDVTCPTPASLANPFFSLRLSHCRLGGFDTRLSRAVIKLQPDSYLNGQLSLDVDGGKSGFCELRALKLPTSKTRVNVSTTLQPSISYPSICVTLLLVATDYRSGYELWKGVYKSNKFNNNATINISKLLKRNLNSIYMSQHYFIIFCKVSPERMTREVVIEDDSTIFRGNAHCAIPLLRLKR